MYIFQKQMKKKKASKLPVSKNEHFQFCPHKIIGNGTFSPPHGTKDLTTFRFCTFGSAKYIFKEKDDKNICETITNIRLISDPIFTFLKYKTSS